MSPQRDRPRPTRRAGERGSGGAPRTPPRRRPRTSPPCEPVSRRRPRGSSGLALLAGGGGDVLRDGLDLRVAQLALERRHRAPADLHLVGYDVRCRLDLVEVRPDCPGRTRGGERVAARAAGSLEDLGPVRTEAREP